MLRGRCPMLIRRQMPSAAVQREVFGDLHAEHAAGRRIRCASHARSHDDSVCSIHVPRPPASKLPCGEGRVGCDLAGKRQLRLLEPDRRLHQFDHVDHVRQIVEDQLSQGLAVAAPVAMPQMYCLKTIHALDRRVAPEAQRPLHGLQPAPIAQRSQREPQVDVGLIQPRLGKMRPQERHVELAAVERDQERELRRRRRGTGRG